MRIKEFLCLFKKYIHSIPSDALLCNDETHLRRKGKNQLKDKNKIPCLESRNEEE